MAGEAEGTSTSRKVIKFASLSNRPFFKIHRLHSRYAKQFAGLETSGHGC